MGAGHKTVTRNYSGAWNSEERLEQGSEQQWKMGTGHGTVRGDGSRAWNSEERCEERWELGMEK